MCNKIMLAILNHDTQESFFKLSNLSIFVFDLTFQSQMAIRIIVVKMHIYFVWMRQFLLTWDTIGNFFSDYSISARKI